MNNQMKVLDELFQCHNLISHVAVKCSVDNKGAIEISDFFGVSRVIITLSTKLKNFRTENSNWMSRYERLMPKGLSDLYLIMSEVTKHYNEDTEEIFDAEAKEQIVLAVTRIREGILSIAGYQIVAMEHNGEEIAERDNPIRETFYIKAKTLYMENEDKKEVIEKMMDETDEFADIESLDKFKYDNEDVVLGSSGDKEASISTDPLK